MLSKLSLMPREVKQAVSVVFDWVLLNAAFWGAYKLRLDDLDVELVQSITYLCAAVVVLGVWLLSGSGAYKFVVRYLDARGYLHLIAVAAISSLSIVFLNFFIGAFVPRSIPFLYFLLLAALLCGSRFLLHSLFSHQQRVNPCRAMVFGAGEAGASLTASLLRSSAYKLVGFIDEDEAKQGTVINGLTVYAKQDLLLTPSRFNVDVVLLAIPSLTDARRRELLNELSQLNVRLMVTPAIDALLSNKAKLTDVYPVALEDIVGRGVIAPKPELMAKDIAGRVVLVTGAAGSIGSELCVQVLSQHPKRLVCLDSSEFGMYQLQQRLASVLANTPLNAHAVKRAVPLIDYKVGSVQNAAMLERLFAKFEIHTVYHAAAYKHVPLMESNVREAIFNNVIGTQRVVTQAFRAKVSKFVLVSTDKAVRPTNVMGASKRLAELVVKRATASKPGSTKTAIVRFGNVMNSSGSVIPLFTQQIEQGGPVTITHQDVTRYFMSIPEASQLIIQAGAQAEAAETFLLDMGNPVRIKDLAVKLIRLQGLRPKFAADEPGDIEVKVTGLRPGEKLYEELLLDGEFSPSQHEKIKIACEGSIDFTAIERFLSYLDNERISDEFLQEQLRFLPIDYQPNADAASGSVHTADTVLSAEPNANTPAQSAAAKASSVLKPAI